MMPGMDPLEHARFVGPDSPAAGYESCYLKACSEDGARAVWIRYTINKRSGEQPSASLWCTVFERGQGRPRAVKQTFGAGELSAPEDEYLVIATAVIGPSHAAGEAEGESRRAAWELTITGAEPLLAHLPRRLYGTSLPRTKLLSPKPSAAFGGWVEFDGDRIALDGWRGMVGHNWGSQHAETWVWLNGSQFEGFGDDTWLDLAIGRIKIGPFTTPWVANGTVSVSGERLALGGLKKPRGTSMRAGAGRAEFTLRGDGVVLGGSVSAALDDTVGWVYADPDGSTHDVLNCSVADLDLRLERAGGAVTSLRTIGGAAYELGSRDRSHGVQLEPYGDA